MVDFKKTPTVNGSPVALANHSYPAGPAMWFDAGQVTGLADGAAIGALADLSGNARDLLQATGGNQPQLKTNIVNGRPVVRFDGADDYLVTATFGATIAQPTTIILVARFRSVAGSGLLFDGKGSGRQNLFITPSQFNPWGGLDFFCGTPDISWHVFTVIFNGASSSVRQDGTQIGSGNLGTQGLDGFAVAAGPTGGGPLPVDFAEGLVYGRVLAAAELQQLEGMLAAEYGLASSAFAAAVKWMTD